MSILSLVLYGSCAREDNSAASDVDLFAITDDDHYLMSVKNKTNMACYPKEFAEIRAQQGDLFFLHLVLEGKVLYDHNQAFEKIKQIFKRKDNYKKETENASDISWMLIDLGHASSNHAMINRRAAWCARTILMAKAADEGHPAFSKDELLRLYDIDSARALIENKDNPNRVEKIFKHLESFLVACDLKRTSGPLDHFGYTDMFMEKANPMGLKTLRAVLQNLNDPGYL
ncbi:nucleotidyltransferase domain-containing protein [Pseudomonas stutzeri]|nr:nucleotidyltransferase domain-containing protein [Stutzerimonas degradans]